MQLLRADNHDDREMMGVWARRECGEKDKEI
jgi:hypothetical protein